MKTNKYYRVIAKSKTIMIDTSLTPTEQDEKEISWYLGAGYVIKHKNQSKAKEALNDLTDTKIKEALEGDKKGLKEYETIKKEKGFFTARSWFKNDYVIPDPTPVIEEKPRRTKKPKATEQ